MEMGRVAKALADPQRCEILERLSAGELCCSDLEAVLPLSQATISHHLKELLEAGLVERRKKGSFGYYRAVPATLEAYMDALRRRFL
ncbi:MAG: regulatory protein ArsR [Cyanobacteria bacterium RYN_339]|nr:regulatory protein ArsR [Cyanobacteria bacterium RYN_339]